MLAHLISPLIQKYDFHLIHEKSLVESKMTPPQPRISGGLGFKLPYPRDFSQVEGRWLQIWEHRCDVPIVLSGHTVSATSPPPHLFF